MLEVYGIRDQSKKQDKDEISIERFNKLFNAVVDNHFKSTFKKGKRRQTKINGKQIDISPMNYVPDETLQKAKTLIKIFFFSLLFIYFSKNK